MPPGERGARLLIVGIDGAAWDVVDPWIARGDLPVLAALRAGGLWGRVRSTTPPATFPAWTSFATAAEPGEHGIFDFSLRRGYGMRFVTARDRAMPSIWSRLSSAGLRVCVYNLPASYPPESLPGGVFISGFDTPVTTSVDPSFVHPRALHAELTRRFGPLVISDLNEARIGRGWHARALETLVGDVRRRGAIARHLLTSAPWDVFFVLFGESDTAGHHFWAFADPRSPRYRPGALGDAMAQVYREIDRSLGELLDVRPRGSTVLVLSDHGMGGAGERAVSLNRFLAEQGLLRFACRPRGSSLAVARAAALRFLPRGLQGRLLRGPGAGLATRLEARSRFAGIDWGATRAFSEELNYFPSVWINLAGREPLGQVPAQEYRSACAEVVAALESWRDPETGDHVIARARSREQVYGPVPMLTRAPDIVVELALEDGYSTTVRRAGGRGGPSVWRLGPEEYLGAKGDGMNGTHRPYGLYCWSGGDVRAGRGEDLRLAALGERVLRHFGLERGAGPLGQPADPAPDPPRAEREARLEARLRALGYLE